VTPDQQKAIEQFRKWAKSVGHYPVVEAVDRYLKMKDTK